MTNFTSWHAGMRVVCVGHPSRGEPPPFPVFNKVYTLKRIWKVRDRNKVLIDLVELPAKRAPGYYTGYRAACFRPVHERKTDISIFTAMLHDKKERVDV